MNACYYGLAPRLKQRILIRPLAKTKNNRNIKEDESMHRKPNHIGIIPDGNRRWATRNGLKKQEGYGHGLSPAGAECAGFRDFCPCKRSIPISIS